MDESKVREELDEVEGLDVQKHAKLASFLHNVCTEPKMARLYARGQTAKLIDESGLSHKHKEILRSGDLHRLTEAVREEEGHEGFCFVFVRNAYSIEETELIESQRAR